MAYVPLQISIPDPCSAEWNSMTPVSDIARHCASCEKTVTDFTHMTDAEIGRTLKANGGNLCGRFTKQQLNRPLRLEGPRRRRGLGPLAAAASMLLSAPVFSQSAPPAPTEQTESRPVSAKATPPGNIPFRGTVADESGEVLIGATILIEGTTCGTVTDLDGNFELLVPQGQDLTLVVHYTGYSTLKQVIPASQLSELIQSNKKQPFTVAMEEAMLGDIVCLVAGGISFTEPKPSVLENLMNHKIDRFVIDRPSGYKSGDWKDYWRDLFAERKARRAERRAQRLARRAEKEVAPVTTPAAMPAKTTSSPAPALATSPHQLRATPNPFDRELTATFTLPEPQSIHLSLLDANGRTLREWKKSAVAGEQSVRLDNLPATLPGGMYFLRLVTKSGAVETVTLVR